MKSSYDKTRDIKVVFVGESSVGKTSIINVANTGETESNLCPTVGACFVVNKYEINNVQIKINIWDTAGQERYRSLAPMYYRDISIAMVVYSIDNRSSFVSIDKWIEGIRNEVDHKPEIYLLGNKSDLQDNRKVSFIEGKEKANEIGARFLEVSAKENQKQILDLFRTIAEELAEELTPKMNNIQIITEDNNEKEKKSCCG